MSSAFDRLVVHAQQWDVVLERTFETDSSVLAFGNRESSPVTLKISKHLGDEWHSGDILRAFAGEGMVRVYESVAGAVLLERLEPGNELVEMVREGNDDQATEILADVMRRLANHPAPDGCTSVLDWALGFDRYRTTGDTRIPSALVQKADEIFRSLASSSSRSMLLHGDLHHYNVLYDEKRAWVAIDPKGVVGELEYEVGAILRNPRELPELFASRPVIESRLRILTDALHLDYLRALHWSFAQAVLSAIWDVEDGYEVDAIHPSLILAGTLEPMLR